MQPSAGIMTDYEAIGDQIIAWALVGSDVTDEPVKARSGARRAARFAARARRATIPYARARRRAGRWAPSRRRSASRARTSRSCSSDPRGRRARNPLAKPPEKTSTPAQLIMRAYPGDGIKLYGVAFLYNIAQVMLCSYMCIEAVIVAKRSNFNLVCNSYDAKNPPMANVLWLFYASKVLDFVDTFFIVIGKKWKQLSFLHVYHHTTIFLFYWLNLHVNYDGDIYLTIVLNGAIHTIMYTRVFPAPAIFPRNRVHVSPTGTTSCPCTRATSGGRST